MYYLNYDDNRITVASLECLQVLFKLVPFKFSEFLTQTNKHNLLSTANDSNAFLSRFFGSSKSSQNNQYTSNKLSGSMDSLNTLKPLNSNADETKSINDESNLSNNNNNNNPVENENLDSYKPVKSIDARLGSFYDSTQPPILYFTRLLCNNFLLNHNYDENNSKKLKPDSNVKVIVKSVALDCCASALSLSPHLLFKPLFINDSNLLYIYDLIEYVNHEDDKMRTNAFSLIGQLINSVIIENDGSYDKWLQKMSKKYPSNVSYDFLHLDSLINNIMKYLRPDSNKSNNMTKRFALTAVHTFLPTLFKTRRAPLAFEILLGLIHLRKSAYNLVKCELIDLIASIDFKTVSYLIESSSFKSNNFKRKRLNSESENLTDTESESEEDQDQEEGEEKCKENKEDFSELLNFSKIELKKIQEKLLDEVFIYLLSSDDSRVRLESARSLTRFVSNMNFFSLTSQTTSQMQNILLSNAENELKTLGGYSFNMLNMSLVENDLFNLNCINLNTNKQDNNYSISNQSFLGPTSLLHGGHSAKRQIRYSCSPLNSLSLNSSLTWLSKSTINNTFIQPFHSLIKYWPSNVSTSQTLSSNMNRSVEHNLNFTVLLLIKNLVESTDKFQFQGILESLDFIFQVYEPAIFYASNPNSNQVLDLINILIALLKHPNVSFDLNVHDILLRLIGSLYCSLSWLTMKKLDKIVQEIYFNLNNNSGITANNIIQSLLDTLNNALKIQVMQNSLAEQESSLNYSYAFGFNNQNVKNCIDQLFVHTMKMLCVLACVIDESSLPSSLTSNLNAGSTAVSAQPPPPPTQGTTQNTGVQTTQQNQPLNSYNPSGSSSSTPGFFLKSKLNTLTENKILSRNNSTASLNSSISSVSLSSSTLNSSNLSVSSTSSNTEQIQQQYSLPKPNSNVYLGNFQNSSHYLKLYEMLKISFNIYKKSSSLSSYDKFNQILKTTLKTFAQLLECALSVNETGLHLDEILLYLKVLFTIEPSCSIKCVTLTLKSLFGLNLSGLMFEYLQQQIIKTSNLNSQMNNNNMQQQQQQQNQNSDKSGQSNSQTMHVSLSGFSSVLSTSLTSIASLTTTPSSNTFNQLTTNYWSSATKSSSSKRQKTSLFTNLIENKFNQFNKFMYSQSVMFRNDNLTGMQFNSTGNLLDLGIFNVQNLKNNKLIKKIFTI
jgi:hypothetical protein